MDGKELEKLLAKKFNLPDWDDEEFDYDSYDESEAEYGNIFVGVAEELDSWYYRRKHGVDPTLDLDGVIVELEEQWGGEGEGDRYGHIIKVSSDNSIQYFQADGFYSSYNGHSWEGAEYYEVEPREVVRREFFPVKSD